MFLNYITSYFGGGLAYPDNILVIKSVALTSASGQPYVIKEVKLRDTFIRFRTFIKGNALEIQHIFSEHLHHAASTVLVIYPGDTAIEAAIV